MFGAGESTFCIASPPTREGYIECSVKAVGKVTAELREVNVGDTIGFRGPLRQLVPGRRLDGQGRRLHRRRHRPGAGALRDLERPRPARRVRRRDHRLRRALRRRPGLQARARGVGGARRRHARQTVDPGGETPDWKGEVGFVTPVVEEAAPRRENAVAVLCGPPIVVKFTLPVLDKLGFAARRRLHDAREPHEVRRRQVRPLQHRPGLRVQGRAGVHRRRSCAELPAEF